METNYQSSVPIEELLKIRTSSRRLLGLAGFCAITVVFLPFSLVFLFLYMRKRKYLNSIPMSSKLDKYLALRDKYITKVIEIEELKESWEIERDSLEFQLECLEKGWGLPLVFAEDAVLCELYLDSDHAPKGFIAGATAVFADNTRSETILTGSNSSTSYAHESDHSSDFNFNKLKSASTNTQYGTQEVRSGSASVQVSGPKIVPGVVLFDSAADAQRFTNILNASSRTTSDAKANLKSNTAVCKDLIKDHLKIAKSGYGVPALSSYLEGSPKEIQDWVLRTAESKRASAIAKSFVNHLKDNGVPVFPVLNERMISKVAENAIKSVLPKK